MFTKAELELPFALAVVLLSLNLTTCGITAGQDNQSTAEQKKKKKPPKNKRDNPDEIGNRDVGKGVNFYSLEKEIAFGKQLAQEIERQVKLVDDPIIAEYVNRLGQNLVMNSDSRVPFTIKVIHSEEINALSLPGGFFFVNVGLILFADNEAQLAGAMAHEIAHVTARHGTRQATRGTIANYATIPLIFVGGWGGYAARQAASMVIPVSFMKFSRAFEQEADFFGLQYLYKAGYDPSEFVNLFEKLEALQRKKPGAISKFFASHPMAEDRIKQSQKNIQEILPAKLEYSVDTSEFKEVQGRLMQMVNRRKPEDQSGKPTLRKTPTGKIGEDGKDKEKDDDRPTLKRRE